MQAQEEMCLSLKEAVTRHQQGADGLSEPEGIALKRVAVVEDFFDIIYSMHVESSAEPGKAPKHAGQKKPYRAIAETYAFLPREAVTRFLMSCTECQKRMHFNSNGVEPKENEPPSSLVSGIIDYNMPLTSTYLKQMKLRVLNSQEQVSGFSLPGEEIFGMRKLARGPVGLRLQTPCLNRLFLAIRPTCLIPTRACKNTRRGFSCTSFRIKPRKFMIFH
ncbi:nucleolar protein 4-like [Python bivittatus]|uniref:Nucleolar protein 4-like n=1 Tax=Python bivittatus TaxID=176946 RepID=A0A9F2RCB1_PYTBI|nr:nucleolar protein 4-like [Python bivittatus]